ncbi:hypothetical protein CR956_00255 [Candidatus Saccharibacteria bacterium]|nr:MAG: hypothetical protein CR956_00255 [Candidatus Saccharibacteria bacterium]
MDQFNDRFNINPKNILITGGVLILALLAYWVFLAIDRSDKTEVEIVTAPANARVTIAGVTENKRPGVFYLKQGEYDISVSREDFKTIQIRLTVSGNKRLVETFPLEPDSARGEEIAQQRTEDYLRIEGIEGAKSNAEGIAFEKKNPIVKDLPIKNLLFSIGYRADPNDENKVIIEIDAPKGYKNAAIKELYRRGIDPFDLNITFREKSS